jgi:AraC-like DNA-binding protein
MVVHADEIAKDPSRRPYGGPPMLFQTLERIACESFAPHDFIDAQRRYRLDLDPTFPFVVKAFRFDRSRFPHTLNFHEALEIFIPVEGRGRFQMGDRFVDFAKGDLVVVDNLKLHGLTEFEGGTKRGIAIVFAREFVHRPGSPVSDLAFLAPFQVSSAAPVRMRVGRSRQCTLAAAVSRLLCCWNEPPAGPEPHIGCKVYLLELLYLLAARMLPARVAAIDYEHRQQEQAFLHRLYGYLSERLTERVSVAEAAEFMGMPRFAFMRHFRRIAGATFVGYLTRLRLDKAVQLLIETDASIGSIASAAGFSDQSYLDRVFREHFGCTPRDMRSACGTNNSGLRWSHLSKSNSR